MLERLLKQSGGKVKEGAVVRVVAMQRAAWNLHYAHIHTTLDSEKRTWGNLLRLHVSTRLIPYGSELPSTILMSDCTDRIPVHAGQATPL